MRKALIYIMLLFCAAVSYAQGGLALKSGERIPMDGVYLEQLQERDSILIADQLEYGFILEGVREGTQFGLPTMEPDKDSPMRIISQMALDTLKISKEKKGQPRMMSLKGSMRLTAFDPGLYELPELSVLRLSEDGVVDTLVFGPLEMTVTTMPVDTASFVPHDIKGQIRYPLTFRELLPLIGGALGLIGLILLSVYLIRRYLRRNNPEYARRDPAHIVALRKLDKYRGNKMWAPEQQKAFYSGVTDILREYMAERYDFGAMEMTTAEIFDEMNSKDAPKELLEEARELFERADFVKFAKFTASDEDNAKALPTAVRFVTETYQAEIEAEEKGGN